MIHRNQVSNGSRPRMWNLGRVKSCHVKSRTNASATPVRSFTLHVWQPLCNINFSLGLYSRQISVSTNNVFHFVVFWNEFWIRGLKFIISLKLKNRREWRVMLINITTKLIYMLTILWPRRNGHQIPGGGCWQRTRTSTEGQTRRQWYVELNEP